MSGDLAPGKHVLGVSFVRQKSGPHGESMGTAQLYVDDQVVAESPWKTQPGHFGLCGDGITVGYGSGDPISQEYEGSNPFCDGKIIGVGIDVGEDVYLDLEQLAAAAMARD